MHRPESIEAYALLPESIALERWFDARNRKAFILLLAAALFTALAQFPVMSSEGELWQALVALVNLVASAALLFLRRKPFIDDNIRPVLLGWIAAEFATLALTFFQWGVLIALAGYIFPLTFFTLRLRPSQFLSLAATFVTGGIWGGLLLRGPISFGSVMLHLFVLGGGCALITAVAMGVSARAGARFLEDWRRVSARERERTRMTEELADARRIQLAMLPAAPPQPRGLAISSLSLPATEVGGDFYDFYELSDGSLAVVVGDVAGHGVASGIVLAGVKSGLFLLAEELTDPVAAARRLDRLVRDWGRWRLLVTLLIGVISPDRRTVRVLTAGHPPLLRVAAEGGFSWIGQGSLPLGTRLNPSYTEVSAVLGPGDALLLFTDGLSELADGNGEPFGNDRIARSFIRATAAASPYEMRDRLLEDVSHFKGDAPQLDDMTLVVMRVL